MNENVKEQADELLADISHSLEWALREHGVDGQLALRDAVLRGLGLQVVGEIDGINAKWSAAADQLDEADGHALYVIK